VSTGSLFVRLPDDTLMPGDHARGPWRNDWLHGGPVAALLAHAVEGLASDGVGWFVTRLTVELERPVTMEPLLVQAQVTRPGRKVSSVEATVSSASTGTVLARARAQRIRQAPVSLPFDDPELAPFLAVESPPPGPEQGRPATDDPAADVAFHRGGTEHRFIADSDATVGPVMDWIRLCVPLFPDEAVTPLQRVVAAADFANGISSVLPWDTFSFVNPDLTVHLYRPLEGEWVGLASATHHGTNGIAMTDTAVFDVTGRVGASNQSLLLDRH
jgi:acyl-coenzyme A thioesterase PaaI-like protein